MDSKVNFGNIVHILSLIKEGKTFNLDDFASRVNLSLDKLLYSLTILSEVYSAEGNSFVDFEVNNEKNIITFDFDDYLLDIITVTDLDLFKIYTLLNNSKINIENLFDNKSDLTFLHETLTKYFQSHHQISANSQLDFNELIISDEIYIEYIKLGHNISNIYKIKPLSFNSTNDGDVIEAYDYEEDKIKSFLIERVVNILEDNSLKNNFSKKDNAILVNYIDDSFNKFEKSFRSEEIAIEHFLTNIDTQNVITPNFVKVEIENRKNTLISELTI